MKPIRLVAIALAGTSLATVTLAAAAVAPAPPVRILAAGSLRGVVTDLAKELNARWSLDVAPEFGGSGLLRERIEKGEKADLFLSADMGSPRKLEALGRTVVPAVPFARNRVCVVSRRATGTTAENLVNRLLEDSARIKTSTPIADPAGDYAWAMFDRIEVARPGAAATLKAKAQALWTVTAPPPSAGQSATAALFAARKIDFAVTYCSASATLEQELPELASLEVPPKFAPHPVYGIAVLSDRPEAERLALFLLSDAGQAIVARNGLVPLTEPAPPSP